jgi:MscS family membrane protein
MLALLETRVYGNDIVAWGFAAFVAAAMLAATLVAKWLLLSRLPESRPSHDLHWPAVFRDLVQRTATLFLIIAAIYAGASLLRMPAAIEKVLFSIFAVALFIQFALWADRIVTALLVWQFAPRKSKAPMRNAISVIEVLVRVGIWSLTLLLIFENLGFDVTALVAGLGIGGVAVALAAQRVLGDLFSSLAIVLDRPFEVGDVIVFGDQRGTVEKIGIKTTRLRSLTGEQIICANTDLIDSRIHNFKRMAERRVKFSLPVVYDTPTAKLEGLPALFKEIIDAQELTRFERAHLRTLGEAAIHFEVVYWVLSPDQNTYMDIQQAINLEILRTFEREEIDFAVPPTARAPEPKEKPVPADEPRRPPRLRASGGSQ